MNRYLGCRSAWSQSELFAFQCWQWETIQNSQLIRKYKKMSGWPQVNLTIDPPVQNCQRTEWTLHCSMSPMRGHSKQSTNKKISGNVSVTPGKSYDRPPQSIEHRCLVYWYTTSVKLLDLVQWIDILDADRHPPGQLSREALHTSRPNQLNCWINYNE